MKQSGHIARGFSSATEGRRAGACRSPVPAGRAAAGRRALAFEIGTIGATGRSTFGVCSAQ